LLLGIAYKSRDTYASLVVIGVTSYFLFHIVTNIAMVIGMMPVVGITLPFFSYGGSSVIVSLFCMGIVLGVSMRRYQFGQS